MQTRRTLIALLAAGGAASALLAACSKGGRGDDAGGADVFVTDDEAVMGSPTAPVTLVEYASVACPVCARFNIDVFPAFKKKYIDSGQVRFVAREMNAHNPPLSAAGFLLARCAGKGNYFKVTDAIYRAQQKMEETGEYRAELLKIAKSVGLSEDKFTACVTDPVAIEAQTARVDKWAKQDNVNSTPTFVIDGQIVAEGFIPLEDLDKIIKAAKTAPAKPAA